MTTVRAHEDRVAIERNGDSEVLAIWRAWRKHSKVLLYPQAVVLYKDINDTLPCIMIPHGN